MKFFEKITTLIRIINKLKYFPEGTDAWNSIIIASGKWVEISLFIHLNFDTGQYIHPQRKLI